MKKKGSGVTATIYMLIVGFLLFVLISCAMTNGVIKAFKSYKGSEKSFDYLADALSEVSNKTNNIALQLVNVEMEENTALFIFQKDTDLQLEYKNTGSGISMLIEKPSQCPYAEQCVCLCKDFELKKLYDGKNADELNNKYAGKYPGIAPAFMYSPDCGKGMTCVIQDDFIISSRITLSELVSSEEYKRIEDAARYGQKPRKNQNFIYLWKGGFVLWRFDGSQETFQSDQFMSSKFLDLYVVNNNVNVKICLDPECGSSIGTP